MRFLDIERALLEHYEPYSEAADADAPRLELPERWPAKADRGLARRERGRRTMELGVTPC